VNIVDLETIAIAIGVEAIKEAAKDLTIEEIS